MLQVILPILSIASTYMKDDNIIRFFDLARNIVTESTEVEQDLIQLRDKMQGFVDDDTEPSESDWAVEKALLEQSSKGIQDA